MSENKTANYFVSIAVLLLATLSSLTTSHSEKLHLELLLCKEQLSMKDRGMRSQVELLSDEEVARLRMLKIQLIALVCISALKIY
jgi:hypothetical protein